MKIDTVNNQSLEKPQHSTIISSCIFTKLGIAHESSLLIIELVVLDEDNGEMSADLRDMVIGFGNIV